MKEMTLFRFLVFIRVWAIRRTSRSVTHRSPIFDPFEAARPLLWTKDYENVSRRHIPVILIIVVQVLTIPYVYFVIHNKIPFSVVYGHWAVCIIVVLLGYLIVLRINILFRNKMDEVGEYSLAKKFQIEENIRSLRMARKSVYVATLYLSITLLVFTCLMFMDYKTVFVHFLENLIVLPALVMSITLLFSSSAWKQEFIRKLPIIGKYRGSRVESRFRQKHSIASESEVYFKQLNNSWK
uniref:Serpentine receptor class gamma n=1 Tax=Caenorhabditis tropicalis TaxID=1561998 RepID=A0A1I7U3S8_9PELO